eukprot:TRINITY_DN33541_c0_g1_i1.p1 TRINITY_DN33541_c0_g1~~TRINITY_DN33541_c0_g1_i1.p1  ORF type:complete len:705 (-),score=159.58 TRINITY_DN33541_c0_g1_i1:18-2132(-)
MSGKRRSMCWQVPTLCVLLLGCAASAFATATDSEFVQIQYLGSVLATVTAILMAAISWLPWRHGKIMLPVMVWIWLACLLLSVSSSVRHSSMTAQWITLMLVMSAACLEVPSHLFAVLGQGVALQFFGCLFWSCNWGEMLCEEVDTEGDETAFVVGAGMQLHMAAGLLAMMHRALYDAREQTRLASSSELLADLNSLGEKYVVPEAADRKEVFQQRDAMLQFIEGKQASLQALLQRGELAPDGEAWVKILRTTLQGMLACLAELVELRHRKEELPSLSLSTCGWLGKEPTSRRNVIAEDVRRQVSENGLEGSVQLRAASKCPGSQFFQTLELARDCSVGRWEFPALNVARDHGNVLRIVGIDLLLSFNMLSRSCADEFLKTLESSYKEDNPYHSNAHAADMANSFSFMLRACHDIKSVLSPARQICMFVAALGHDVGHPGFSNLFHINSSHELAIVYNDRSILENFHAAELMRILARPYGKQGTKLLAGLSQQQFQTQKQTMIRFILSTDMSKHFPELAEFRLALDSKKFDPVETAADQDTALMWLFRAADISHAAKPWDLHEEWSKRITQEFHSQGDEEKRLGLPVSPLCEREGFNMAESQSGFLQFVCIPTFKQLARLQSVIQNSSLNRAVSLMASPPLADTASVSAQVKASTFDALVSVPAQMKSMSAIEQLQRQASDMDEITDDTLAKVCLELCKANLQT